MTYDLLAIGFGGFLGAITRYLLSGWMVHRFPEFAPAGTLLVNLAGCLLIGFLWGWAGSGYHFSDRGSLFLMTGFLGSLTTFSTFGYQTVRLLKNGEPGMALANVSVSLILGLLLVWIGFAISSAFNSSTLNKDAPPGEVTTSHVDHKSE